MQTSGCNEQWDVIEVTQNDLIGTVGCLIMGIMDLLKGQLNGTGAGEWREEPPCSKKHRDVRLSLEIAGALLYGRYFMKHDWPQNGNDWVPRDRLAQAARESSGNRSGGSKISVDMDLYFF